MGGMHSPSMPLEPERLKEEIRQVLEILTSLSEKLDKGIPGDELPANDMNIEIFQYRLRGTIMLASERLSSIAEVLE
jgi:hypothetical protein